MNIWITGANGQLGHEITEILKQGRSELGDIPACFLGANVICTGKDSLNIADADAVKSFAESGRFDLIINCAAYTKVDQCETNHDEAFRVNSLGPRNLAIAAEKAGAKLIHVSTDYVFDGTSSKPYAEWEICSPQSIYGKSKHLGEQYVRDFCSRYFIVRTSWLYGVNGKNFVKTILKAAKEKGILTVVNDQFGNPTNAADLAYHVLKIAATEQYGVYHCTGNGVCSWYDFACKIVQDAGIPCTVTPCTSSEYPSPVKRPAFSALDHQMLRNTVGDEMRNWQDALKSFIEQIDNKG